MPAVRWCMTYEYLTWSSNLGKKKQRKVANASSALLNQEAMPLVITCEGATWQVIPLRVSWKARAFPLFKVMSMAVGMPSGYLASYSGPPWENLNTSRVFHGFCKAFQGPHTSAHGKAVSKNIDVCSLLVRPRDLLHQCASIFLVKSILAIVIRRQPRPLFFW